MSKPRILSTSVLAESRMFRIESSDIAFSNGASGNFEYVRTAGEGVVMVAAINADDELVLVNEYAACADRYELGMVKGKIDPGETPEIAADRELREEAGVGANNLHYFRSVTMSPAYTDFITHLFVATDLFAADAEGDELEPLQQTLWPMANIDQLFDREDITDARVLFLLGLLQRARQAGTL